MKKIVLLCSVYSNATTVPTHNPSFTLAFPYCWSKKCVAFAHPFISVHFLRN